MTTKEGDRAAHLDFRFVDRRWATIEMDSRIVRQAAPLGLVRWRDGGWEVTDKGAEVAIDYGRRTLYELLARATF